MTEIFDSQEIINLKSKNLTVQLPFDILSTQAGVDHQKHGS